MAVLLRHRQRRNQDAGRRPPPTESSGSKFLHDGAGLRLIHREQSLVQLAARVAAPAHRQAEYGRRDNCGTYLPATTRHTVRGVDRIRPAGPHTHRPEYSGQPGSPATKYRCAPRKEVAPRRCRAMSSNPEKKRLTTIAGLLQPSKYGQRKHERTDGGEEECPHTARNRRAAAITPQSGSA